MHQFPSFTPRAMGIPNQRGGHFGPEEASHCTADRLSLVYVTLTPIMVETGERKEMKGKVVIDGSISVHH